MTLNAVNLYDPYQDTAIDPQHQDDLGVLGHLLCSLKNLLRRTRGPRELLPCTDTTTRRTKEDAQRDYDEISYRLVSMRSSLRCSVPSRGLKHSVTLSVV